MPVIRPFASDDLDALYDICLATDVVGQAMGAVYEDGRMLGHIYVAPYAVLTPEWTLVAEDERGVFGYVVGAVDTPEFEALLERDWWPALRRRYDDPDARFEPEWTADQRCAAAIHHPHHASKALVQAYPAHMHLNVLARGRGKGVGRRLCEAWIDMAREAGVTGVHVGVSARNAGGLAFWQKCGLFPLPEHATESEVWLGRRIGE